MSYHYIEFMIKEQRKEEVEDCNRLRLLKRAGYSHTSCMVRMFVALSKKNSFWKDRVRFMGRSLVRFFSHRISQTNQKGRRA